MTGDLRLHLCVIAMCMFPPLSFRAVCHIVSYRPRYIESRQHYATPLHLTLAPWVQHRLNTWNQRRHQLLMLADTEVIGHERTFSGNVGHLELRDFLRSFSFAQFRRQLLVIKVVLWSSFTQSVASVVSKHPCLASASQNEATSGWLHTTSLLDAFLRDVTILHLSAEREAGEMFLLSYDSHGGIKKQNSKVKTVSLVFISGFWIWLGYDF